MALPKSVTMFGYRIKIVQKDIDEHGLCDWDSKVITLRDSDPTDIQQATLFHELLHMALALGGTKYLLSDKEEEAVVRTLENGLWPLLKKTWR